MKLNFNPSLIAETRNDSGPGKYFFSVLNYTITGKDFFVTCLYVSMIIQFSQKSTKLGMLSNVIFLVNRRSKKMSFHAWLHFLDWSYNFRCVPFRILPSYITVARVSSATFTYSLNCTVLRLLLGLLNSSKGLIV